MVLEMQGNFQFLETSFEVYQGEELCCLGFAPDTSENEKSITRREERGKIKMAES